MATSPRWGDEAGPVILRAGNKKENCEEAENVLVLYVSPDGGRMMRVYHSYFHDTIKTVTLSGVLASLAELLS